ncbi:MAG: BatD family protein [Chthoniobacterales bacterium]
MSIACYPNKIFAAAFLIALLFTGLDQGLAQSTPIKATLSRSTTQVGQPVLLHIELIGISTADVPLTVDVPDLDIRWVNRSQKIMVDNGNMTSTRVDNYQVTPRREGDFKIPSISVLTARNQRLHTEPLQLHVVARGGAGGGSSASKQSSDKSEVAFAQLQAAKTTCYVGETIPVTLRFCIQEGTRCKINQFPSFGGDGFTIPRLERPEESSEEINGIPYHVMTFKTSVTPVKSGALTIQPAQFNCILQVAPSNNEDMIAQFLGGQTMGREALISSNPISLNVKSPPKEGRPENFNGAIGDFAIRAEATPKRAQASEPVTLKLILTGKGNFDALTAPVLTGVEGWKTYSPKEAVAPTDANGFGKKTFDYILIAEEAKSATPGSQFSYFDPVKERYVTLHTSGVTVQAAAPISSPTPTAAAATADATPTPAPKAAEASAPKSNALPILTKEIETSSFRSPVWSLKFVLAQTLAFVLWLLLIGYVVLKKINSGEKARRRELEKEADKKWADLSQESDRKKFYQDAIMYLRQETALRTEKAEADISLKDILTSRTLDSDIIDQISRIFERNEEMVYGHVSRSGDIPSQERSSVIESIQKFHDTHVS